MKIYDILWEKTIKCRFWNDDFIVFGIQWADVAEPVLKNDVPIVLGVVLEIRENDPPKQCCHRFGKQCAGCFEGSFQNKSKTTCQNNTLIDFENNARVVCEGAFERLPTNRYKRPSQYYA
jgi:hypothetical protein